MPQLSIEQEDFYMEHYGCDRNGRPNSPRAFSHHDAIKPRFTTSTGKFPNHAYLPQGISLHWTQDFLVCYKNGTKCFHSHIVNRNDVMHAIVFAVDNYIR